MYKLSRVIAGRAYCSRLLDAPRLSLGWACADSWGDFKPRRAWQITSFVAIARAMLWLADRDYGTFFIVLGAGMRLRGGVMSGAKVINVSSSSLTTVNSSTFSVVVQIDIHTFLFKNLLRAHTANDDKVHTRKTYGERKDSLFRCLFYVSLCKELRQVNYAISK